MSLGGKCSLYPLKPRGHLSMLCPHNSRSFTLTCLQRVAMAEHLTELARSHHTISSNTQIVPEHPRSHSNFLPWAQGRPVLHSHPSLFAMRNHASWGFHLQGSGTAGRSSSLHLLGAMGTNFPVDRQASAARWGIPGVSRALSTA